MKPEMRSPDPHRDQNLNQLCNLKARNLIRHEDSLQSIHSQDSFILYLNRGAQGIVPQLLQDGQGLAGGERTNETSPSKSDADSDGPDDATLYQLLQQAHRRDLHEGQSHLILPRPPCGH